VLLGDGFSPLVPRQSQSAAEMSVHWASLDIHNHMAEVLPGANQLYVNHDVAKLVGETLGLMTLKAREPRNRSDCTGLSQGYRGGNPRRVAQTRQRS